MSEESKTAGAVRERNYFVDNLKVALILLVIVGHFCKRMKWIPGFRELQSSLYMFHMPCFVFVSGYLAGNLYRDGRYRSEKVVSLMWTYFLYKVALCLVRYAFRGVMEVRWFYEKESSWYLLCLLVWYLMVPFLKSFKPIILIPFTMLLGIAAGCINSLGADFSAQRMASFLPFFALGLCLSGKKLGDYPRDGRLRVLGIALFAACIAGLVCFYPQLRPLSRLFSGGVSYRGLKYSSEAFGSLCRLVWYPVAALVSFLFMQLIPRRRIWISSMGARTLQIYMGHVLIRNAILYAGLFDYTKGMSAPLCWAMLWGGSVLLLLILGNPLLAKAIGLLTNPPIFKKMMR